MVAPTTIPGLFQTGTHAARPAATAVGAGTLFACSTHGIIYQSDGAAWTTWFSGGGAGGGMTLISEQVLGSDAAFFDFASIPNTFKDLFLSYVVRSDHTSTDNLYIRVGSGSLDTGATQYTSFAPYAGTTSATINNTGSAYGFIGIIPGTPSNPGYFAAGDITIQDYASTTKTRNIRGNSGYYDNGVSAYFVYDSWVTWKNVTQAIDIVRLYPMTGPNFKAGSKAALYGRA